MSSSSSDTRVTNIIDKNVTAFFNEKDTHIETFKTVENHIYFYCAFNNISAIKLNMELKKLETSLLKKNTDNKHIKEYIYLHINSLGGSLFSAFSIIGTIKGLKVPVISIIEGGAASSATLISIVCDYRIMYKSSFMLIHQLSTVIGGTFEQLQEQVENTTELMKQIKDIYLEHTKITQSDLDEILKHDMWWNTDICLEKGLIDVIQYDCRKYKFDVNDLE